MEAQSDGTFEASQPQETSETSEVIQEKVLKSEKSQDSTSAVTMSENVESQEKIVTETQSSLSSVTPSVTSSVTPNVTPNVTPREESVTPMETELELECKLKKCKARFESNQELKAHLRHEHFCDMCDFISPHAVRLNSHKTEVHGLKPSQHSVTPMKTDVTIKVLKHFKYNFCNFHGQRIKEMSNHAKENHEGEWFNMKNWKDIATKLDDPNEVIKSSTSAVTTSENVESQEKPQETQTFKCDTCHIPFKKKWILENHMKICNPSEKVPEKVSENVEEEPPGVPCDTCDFIAKSNTGLAFHYQSVHNLGQYSLKVQNLTLGPQEAPQVLEQAKKSNLEIIRVIPVTSTNVSRLSWVSQKLGVSQVH